MKQNTQRKTPTEVHTFRCTRDELEKLRELAAECGLSLSRYVVAAALKHRPRKRLTSDEVEARKGGFDKNQQRSRHENG